MGGDEPESQRLGPILERHVMTYEFPTCSVMLDALRAHFGTHLRLQAAISDEQLANMGMRRMDCVAALWLRYCKQEDKNS